MRVLMLGIAVFLGVHGLTAFREMRTGLIERFGLGPVKSSYFSGNRRRLCLHRLRLLSLSGGDSPSGHSADVCLRSAGVHQPRARDDQGLDHPMLAAVKVWALARLLANGGAGGMLLFGSFLAWAVFDPHRRQETRRPWSMDFNLEVRSNLHAWPQ